MADVDYIVFHTTEAGSPAAYLAHYGAHGYVFEPVGYEYGPYSKLYETKEQAEEAAQDDMARCIWEGEAYEGEEVMYY